MSDSSDHDKQLLHQLLTEHEACQVVIDIGVSLGIYASLLPDAVMVLVPNKPGKDPVKIGTHTAYSMSECRLRFIDKDNEGQDAELGNIFTALSSGTIAFACSHDELIGKAAIVRNRITRVITDLMAAYKEMYGDE